MILKRTPGLLAFVGGNNLARSSSPCLHGATLDLERLSSIWHEFV